MVLGALLLASCKEKEDTVSFPLKMERHVLVSEGIGYRTIDVYLPPDYDPGKHYTLLLAGDGQALFDTSQTWNAEEWGLDETLNALIANGSVPPLIALGIHNGDKYRRSEYFPGKALDRMPDSTAERLKSDYLEGESCSVEYLDFLVEELLPWAGALYSIDTAAVYLLGSSSGALSAMYALCEHPDQFRGAACLSTHWPGRVAEFDTCVTLGILDYLDDRLPFPGKHRWYFDCGDTGLDSLYGFWQSKADSLYFSKGYSEKDYLSLRFSGHSHTERYWAERLPGALNFLFSPSSNTGRVQPEK